MRRDRSLEDHASAVDRLKSLSAESKLPEVFFFFFFPNLFFFICRGGTGREAQGEEFFFFEPPPTSRKFSLFLKNHPPPKKKSAKGQISIVKALYSFLFFLGGLLLAKYFPSFFWPRKTTLPPWVVLPLSSLPRFAYKQPNNRRQQTWSSWSPGSRPSVRNIAVTIETGQMIKRFLYFSCGFWGTWFH